MNDQQPMKSRLFQAGNGFGNAVLNFRNRAEDEFDLYAHAFHNAGKTLAKEMMSPNGYNDLAALPIIFVYRHSLELYLKSIVRIGKTILKVTGDSHNINKKALERHELTKLLPDVIYIFKHVGWEWNLDTEGLQSFGELEELLQDFDGIDDRSFTFRYPTNKRDQASVPRHFIVNIPIFCDQMNTLLELLEGATILLKEMRYSH